MDFCLLSSLACSNTADLTAEYTENCDGFGSSWISKAKGDKLPSSWLLSAAEL